jgi:hypothetical protein
MITWVEEERDKFMAKFEEKWKALKELERDTGAKIS